MKSPIWHAVIPTVVFVVFASLWGTEVVRSNRFEALNTQLTSLVQKQKELIEIQGRTLDSRQQIIDAQTRTIDAQKRIIAADEDNVGVCVSMLPIEQRRSFQGGN